MMDFLLVELGAWHWSFLGLILLFLEMVFPGAFLIWIGVAALITAGFTYVFDLMFVGQLMIFVFSSLVCIAYGTWFYRSLEISKEPALINRKAEQMVGFIFELSDPIVNGVGHMKVGDTRWRVEGPDLAAGSKVVVVNLSGNSLIVESVNKE